MAAAAASPASFWMSAMITYAPSRAATWAQPRPIPCAAPVMTIIFSFKRFVIHAPIHLLTLPSKEPLQEKGKKSSSGLYCIRGRASNVLIAHWWTDEQHRARCMIQDKASHMSYRLWSKSGPPKCWRARTNDNQAGIPLRSTLDDLSLWPSFTRERFRLGNVA